MKTTEIFNTLGNERRIAIIKALAEKPLFVHEIMRKTKMKQADCSQVLSKLRLAGMLECTKTGTLVSYKLADLAVLNVIKLVEEISFYNGGNNKSK